MSYSTPVPGQLVEVRSQYYVVLDIKASSLPPDPLVTRKDGPQHLVSLSSVEEDHRGEELQVIWEIEPGAQILEGVAKLPSPDNGFDDPARFDAFLNAIRWGAISSADDQLLQAPFRSGITHEDYQMEPLVRALQMPRANLLIADDVGLGKTIETGLVIQELILRHRARSVLIVCPASLQYQWQSQMREKFGLDFVIVDSERMKKLRRRRGLHVNPWNHHPRLITSIDYLKRERPMRLFREVLPGPNEPAYPRRFDLLVVDEAHNVAPAGTGNYATDSQRTLAVRTLTPHFEHKLFLTATPHNGYKESFSALLELLDDQRFARSVTPDDEQRDAVMVRRLKSELKDWDGSPKFPPRHIVPLEVTFSDREKENFSKLQQYLDLRKAGAVDGAVKTAIDFIAEILKKRLFSSPAAFLATLEKHEKTLRGIRERRTRRRPTALLLKRQRAKAEEDYASDEEYEENLDQLIGEATNTFESLSVEEKALLRSLKDWANEASRREDSKAKMLLDWIEATVKTEAGWNNERVIVFTEYRATQKYLHGLMASRGLARDGRLETIYGGMDKEEREEIKAAFQTAPEKAKVRILLATDAASEGIDLQNFCHRIVHYEIPWNPNRLEQRNGRVDRHGQKHEVLAHHFVPAGYDPEAPVDKIENVETGDLLGEISALYRVAGKIERMAADLKGKVNPVIAAQIAGLMRGDRRDIDTTNEEQQGEAIRAQLKSRRNIEESLQRALEQLEETREKLHASPEEVKAVVDLGLELGNQPPMIEAELEGVWPDPDEERTECPVFSFQTLRRGWEHAVQGLEHPHTHIIRPVTFDHTVAAGNQDVVLLHLNHPLVQMCQRLLRDTMRARSEQTGVTRVTARLVPDEIASHPAVIAHGRIVVLGGDNRSLYEEIISAAGTLESGRFRRLNIGQTDQLEENVLTKAAPESARERYVELWPSIEESVMSALEARMRERTKTLENRMTDRARREADKIETVLKELEAAIRRELEEPKQQELFGEEEQQRDRDRDALATRLEEIPNEIQLERQRVTKRYSNPVPRLFPVAVTFIVPESMARRS